MGRRLNRSKMAHTGNWWQSMAEKDACYRKIKASYKCSERSGQPGTAKCRKSKGQVRGPRKQSLRRWAREKWVDKKTGKPCGLG